MFDDNNNTGNLQRSTLMISSDPDKIQQNACPWNVMIG